MSNADIPPSLDESVPKKRANTNPPPMDFAEIENFGVTETTLEDMALLMQVPLERLKRQLENPQSRTYRCYERGRAKRRQSIRRKAYQVAIGAEAGNVPLLVRFLEIEKNQQEKTNNQDELLGKLVQSLTDEQKQSIVNAALGNLSKTQEAETHEDINDEHTS